MKDALTTLVNKINAQIAEIETFQLGPYEPFKQEAVKKLIEAKGWIVQAMFNYNAQTKASKGGAQKELPPVPQGKS